MPTSNFDSRSAGSWAGFLAGASVGAACMYLIDPRNGSRRRGLIRDKAAHVAATLRAATNHEARQLSGVAAGHRAINIEKTVGIAAPVAAVFDFWTRLETFPFFMTDVLELKPANGGRHYHWKIGGPGRTPIEFGAVLTRFEPNRVLAWKTSEASPVAHAGVIQFEPDGADFTRVHIQFSCNPPEGDAGHAIALLLGDDPKAKIDEDLSRTKTAIETGFPPAVIERQLL